jgi:Tfp pilus assembly protein PilN
LPSTDEAEIERMAEFQAAKQLPFSKEEIAVGHKTLGTDNDGFSRVALVVVQIGSLNNYLDMLESAGLSNARLVLSTEAILNSFLSGVQDKDIMSIPYLLIDMDYLSTELIICSAASMRFSRAFAHGLAALSSADSEQQRAAWTKTFLDQIRQSFVAFEKDKSTQDKTIRKIFVCGGVGASFEYIGQALNGEFGVPVEYVDNLQAAASDDLRGKPVSFSSVIGMAGERGALMVDLLPSQMKAVRNARRKRSELVRFYVLSAAILALLFIFTAARISYRHMHIKYLQERLAQIRSEVSKAERIIEKLKVANQQEDRYNTPLEVLREFYQVLPADINLSSLSIAENKTVVLRGTSTTMARVFEIVPILEKSKHFKDVKVVFTNKRKTQDGQIADFQINCLLRPGR